jgi:hypothetical protein
VSYTRGRRACVGTWIRETESLDSAWRRMEGQMAEIEADLESVALNLSIGKATDVIGWDTAARGPEGSKSFTARGSALELWWQWSLQLWNFVSWSVDRCYHGGHWPSMEACDSTGSVLEAHERHVWLSSAADLPQIIRCGCDEGMEETDSNFKGGSRHVDDWNYETVVEHMKDA